MNSLYQCVGKSKDRKGFQQKTNFEFTFLKDKYAKLLRLRKHQF